MSPALDISEAEFMAVMKEWRRLSIDEPERFESIVTTLKSIMAGEGDSVAECDLAFFKHLLGELRAKASTTGAP